MPEIELEPSQPDEPDLSPHQQLLEYAGGDLENLRRLLSHDFNNFANIYQFRLCFAQDRELNFQVKRLLTAVSRDEDALNRLFRRQVDLPALPAFIYALHELDDVYFMENIDFTDLQDLKHEHGATVSQVGLASIVTSMDSVRGYFKSFDDEEERARNLQLLTGMKTPIGDLLTLFNFEEARKIYLDCPPETQIDGIQIYTVWELIYNAMKYAKEGTPIAIAAQHPDGIRVTNISDTEPPEEPFGLGTSGNGKQKGSGIGLFLARSLAQANGCDIELKTAPGRTSDEFVVSFQYSRVEETEL